MKTSGAPVILAVEAIVSFLLAFFILFRYANLRKQNPLVTGTTLLIWFLSFFVVFLLPIDVTSSFYHNCLDTVCNMTNEDGNVTNSCCHDYACSRLEPEYEKFCSSKCHQSQSFICDTPLNVLWNIIYWTLAVFTWVLVPLAQSYVLASYFSIYKKLLRALIENLVVYITLLVIFTAIIIYMLANDLATIHTLPAIVATACNTWGLLIVTLLLGYGLVEVPRSFWYASRRQYTLNHAYFKAAKLYGDLAEAKGKLKEIKERVKSASQEIRYNDPDRKYVEKIIHRFPEEMRSSFNRGQDDFEDYHSDGSDHTTVGSLESLLGKTIRALRVYHRKQLEWEDLTDKLLDLEDTITNSKSSTRIFQSSVRKPWNKHLQFFMPVVEWYWKVWCRDWFYRIMAVVLALLSITLVWSEATFGFSINDGMTHLSVSANLVYHGHKENNYAIVELISVLTVAYLSVCAYYTVFHIKLFDLYYLTGNHSTDEYSLLFSAMLLSRLALPICLNYLYMINVVQLQPHNVDVPTTQSTKVTGEPGLIPWITRGFYIYYPLLIVVLCLGTLFKVGTRIMSVLGYENFLGEDDFSIDFIDEGKTLMKRERRIRERNIERGILRDRYNLSSLEDTAQDSEELQRKLKEYSRTKRRSLTSAYDDRSPLASFIGGAKGFVSRQTARFHSGAKYQRFGHDSNSQSTGSCHGDNNDEIKLLSMNATPPSRTSPERQDFSRPKRGGLFDDV